MIEVTTSASDQLKKVLEEESEPDAALRIIVVPAGNGVQYMLSIEKESKKDDLTIEADGVRIVVDSDSAPLLEGSNIDFVDGLDRSGFVINNPNIQGGGGCGCGGNCSCGGH